MSWIGLLVLFIACSIVWIVLRVVNASRAYIDESDQLYKMSQFTDYVHIVVDTGVLFFSSPMVRYPKIWSERFLVISICLMSIIVISYFESVLATVFVRPLYYRDINSIDELQENRLRIEVDKRIAIDPFFNDDSSLRQLIDIVENTHPLSHIAEHGNLSMIVKESSIKSDFSHWFRLKKLHQLPDCPRTYITAYVLPKRSIYLRRINEILLRLTQGGFIRKWIDDTIFNVTMASTKLYGILEERDFVVLEMVDMQLPFFVLLGGIVCSVFLFIGELCSNVALIEF